MWWKSFSKNRSTSEYRVQNTFQFPVIPFTLLNMLIFYLNLVCRDYLYICPNDDDNVNIIVQS